MPRQTKKYTAACSLLGLPSTARLPHAAVYGMLALRGFKWNGKRWESDQSRGELTASIRITAHEDYITQLTIAISDLLEFNGATVRSQKGPYTSQKSSKLITYINFSHPRSEE